MAGASNQVAKADTIRNILKNPTYLEDSGLYQKVKKGLERMSLDDLGSLELIIQQKDNTPYLGDVLSATCSENVAS